jgi:acyl carrier protein
MFQFVEPRVRRVVAEHLGVGIEELTPDISLLDDLAADSLDLVEVALAIETELGIALPESEIDRIRTFGDLVDIVHGITCSRSGDVVLDPASVPQLVWVRVWPPDEHAALIHHAGWLTPYTAETIAEDALRAGRGARLEVSVPSGTTDLGLAELQDEFAWLKERGVQVQVRRQQHFSDLGQPAHPDAA